MDRGKWMIGSLVVTLLLAVSTPEALAGPWGGYGAREGNQQGRQEQRQGGGQRPDYQRDDRRDAQRPQRMSPEERSQLRRDVRDAGREIYPPRRR